MGKVEVIDWVDRNKIQENPDKVYLFGDNDARVGLGGQADACRGLPNTIGIATKKLPTMAEEAFYTDDELSINKAKVDKDMAKALEALLEGKTIAIPKDGFGSGSSELPTRAPKTLRYIERWIEVLETTAGMQVHMSAPLSPTP